jgi:hypothetical protein
MTSIRRLVAVLSVLLVAAACQTVGGGPSPKVQGLLLTEGFSAESTEAFNARLKSDDIRTTALYKCDRPSCGGLALVSFGDEPVEFSAREDLERLVRQKRSEGLREANKIFRSAGLKDISVVNYGAFNAADGAPGYVMDLRGKFVGETVFMRITVVYRNKVGRMVLAISSSRSVTNRFAGREMLE